MNATAGAENVGAEFLDSVYGIPGGEKIRQCIQCGTCSASCPASEAMEYGPREIVAALRAGVLDRVLNSNTVWLCVSCYSCTVRCPVGIPFTDTMYELKRLEVERGFAQDSNSALMARAFVETVDRYGRNAEATLLRKYYLRRSPLKALKQVPLALKLLLRGRLSIFPDKIKGLGDLHKMMAAIDEKADS
jgi:heterodisulfide reductase subunit C